MKRTTKIFITVGTALSLGLAAAAVSAQPYGPGWGGGPMGGYGPGWHMGGYGPGSGMGPGMMGGYGPGYGMGPQARFGGNYGNVDDNLAALKTELGITAKQDAAWQAFTKNAKQQNENRQAWFAKMQQARSAGLGAGTARAADGDPETAPDGTRSRSRSAEEPVCSAHAGTEDDRGSALRRIRTGKLRAGLRRPGRTFSLKNRVKALSKARP